MLQSNSSVLSTVSPPESGFHPRREFVRDSHISSSFSLLSIANVNSVRLTSFAPAVVTALGSYFESHGMLQGVREEPKLNVIEYKLEGKPWAQSRKSADSEKLFLEVIAIVFQQGYRFLSTIDYGREQSERVTIAFSKPNTLSASEAAREPFALSFPSSTVLRVVNAPLNSSPAILQAARSAWPRGVVSEKKISDKCFEFRLKGYKWFQEDNFASDSLQHILSLLNTLDRYGFTLLTSISLSGNHSRVKDLWIFSGTPLEPSNEQNTSGSNLELSSSSPAGSKHTLEACGRNSPPFLNRSADAVGSQPALFQAISKGHSRSVTDPVASPTRNGSLLRKKPPSRYAGTPTSEHSGYRRSSEEFPYRHQQQLSAIESVDMTGIGSAAQQRFYKSQTGKSVRSTSPQGHPHQTHESPAYLDLTQQERPRVKTGDIFYETTGTDHRRRSSSTPELDSSPHHPRYSSPGGSSTTESRPSSRQLTPRDHVQHRPPSDVPHNVGDGERVMSEARTESTMPILGPTAFRDSAFSSSTSHSYEIPIAWTGPEGEKERLGKGFGKMSPGNEKGVAPLDSPDVGEDYPKDGRPSPMPRFPGGWQPTPIDEKPEHQYPAPSSPVKVKDFDRASPERKQVDAERVASPTFSAQRKSEVALYGMAPSSPDPRRDSREQARTAASSPTKSEGWVLVNIADDSAGATSPSSPSRPSFSRANSPRGSSRPAAERAMSSTLGSSLSPIAKAIVAQDAAKQSSSHASTKEKEPSGIRRLFSRSKSQKVSKQEGRERKSSIRDRWLKKTTASI